MGSFNFHIRIHTHQGNKAATKIKMILLIALNILLINPSWGIMTREDFESFIDPICFKPNKEGVPEINGQEKPLANTLENFIALAEKFEEANSGKDLKDELFYFLRNYTYPNIEFTTLGDVTPWEPKEADYTVISTLWEPDANTRIKYPEINDPFTDDEKCSLFTMISHSIIRKPKEIKEEQRSVVPVMQNGNNSNSDSGKFRLRNEIKFDIKELYPMEQGVVAVQGTNEAVELGRILMGLYVGLRDHNQRMSEILDLKSSLRDKIPSELALKTVDPLYTLTLAEVVAMAAWRPEAGIRQHLADNGIWRSVPINSDIETQNICPMAYRLPDGTENALSISSFRGAADGLILGKVIGEVKSKKNDIKLSQILRQYYSLHGFTAKTPDHGDILASFCYRQDLINKFDAMIKDQVRLFIYLATKGFAKINESVSFTEKEYAEIKNKVFYAPNQDLKKFCESRLSLDNPENLPVESPLDVIAILNAGTPVENWKRQQKIVGELTKRLKLSHSGSKVTIFTDQRVTPSVSVPGMIYLKPIVEDTYNPACAACSVTQIEYDKRDSLPEDEVIIALNQYLVAKEENETQYSGVNGKVVILFNFEEDVPPPGKPSAQQVKLEKALRDLHLRHRDVTIYPLGKNIEVLRKFSKGDSTFPMSAFDLDEDKIGEQLHEKIIETPAKLQYSDCDKAQNEKSAIYEDFVTPNSIQHWSMPPKYFYKSFNYKFIFESLNGAAKVCYNRDTKYPEREAKNCHDVVTGSPLHLPDSNPCKGLTEVSCSPFYFAIMGVGNNSTTRATNGYCDDRNTGNKCLTMDQVKFKISHEGIRCSGAMGLISTPFLSLIALVIFILFSKLS